MDVVNKINEPKPLTMMTVIEQLDLSTLEKIVDNLGDNGQKLMMYLLLNRMQGSEIAAAILETLDGMTESYYDDTVDAIKCVYENLPSEVK